MNESRIAQYTYLGFRKVFVAQSKRVFYDFRKMRMCGRLSVSCKSQYIRDGSVFLHILQTGFQCGTHFLSCGERLLGTMVGIKPALAINAVESAHLTVFRQQIDSQRYSQTAGMNGTEYGRRINDSHLIYYLQIMI